MKSSFYALWGVIAIFACLLQSCGQHDGEQCFWVLYVSGNDTVLVEYPVSVMDAKHRNIFSNEKVDFATIEVKQDTLLRSHNLTVNGHDFTNIEVHVSRQTYNNDVQILFVQESLEIHRAYDNLDYLILDSLMNIYGVTLPMDQERICIPITPLPYQ